MRAAHLDHANFRDPAGFAVDSDCPGVSAVGLVNSFFDKRQALWGSITFRIENTLIVDCFCFGFRRAENSCYGFS